MVMGTVRKYNPQNKSVKVSTIQKSKKNTVVDNRQLTKKIKQVIIKNKEPKWLQGEITDFPVIATDTGYVFNFTSRITEGDGVDNRDGDTIFLRYIKGAFRLVYTLTDLRAPQNFRMILVKSNVNPADSATFNASNIPTFNQTVHSLINNANGDIQVLFDKIVELRGPASSATEKVVKFSKKLNYKYKYDDGLTGSTKPKSNLLLYIFTTATLYVESGTDTGFEYLIGWKDL